MSAGTMKFMKAIRFQMRITVVADPVSTAVINTRHHKIEMAKCLVISDAAYEEFIIRGTPVAGVIKTNLIENAASDE